MKNVGEHNCFYSDRNYSGCFSDVKSRVQESLTLQPLPHWGYEGEPWVRNDDRVARRGARFLRMERILGISRRFWTQRIVRLRKPAPH